MQAYKFDLIQAQLLSRDHVKFDSCRIQLKHLTKCHVGLYSIYRSPLHRLGLIIIQCDDALNFPSDPHSPVQMGISYPVTFSDLHMWLNGTTL